MDYLSIKNLDKYQPHYRDNRAILWVRWDIEASRDYRIAKLNPAQRWLFISLICLACKHKNQIPYDLKWLSEETRYDNKHILNDLKMLQTQELLVTNCNELLQNDTYIHTDILIHTDNIVLSDFFNYYLLKTKKAFKLTPSNRALITKRLEEGFTIEQLKLAVDNFIQDEWPDRHKHLDLIYCIGKQNGKPDNLEKWINYKPKAIFKKP